MCAPETLLKNIVRKIQTIVHACDEIPASNFIFQSSNLDSELYYNQYCDTMNFDRRMSQTACHNFEMIVLSSVPGFINNLGSEVTYNIKNKSKKFVCFNKVHRYHRVELLSKMLESKLIEQGYYSFEGGHSDWMKQSILVNPTVEKTLNQHKDLFPLRLEGGITENRHNPIFLEVPDLKYHDDSYFSIVTETIFYEKTSKKYNIEGLLDYFEGVFLTEKTYRPIALKHPFILLAAPYSLQKLRERGYKTFSPYIDESYDTETCGDTRFEMIWKEINRLCNFSDSEWITWQNNIQPIVEHNYHFLKSQKDFSLKDYGYLFNN